MANQFNLLVLMSFLIGISSCTTSYIYRPVTKGSENMDVIYSDGYPINYSFKPNSTIALLGERTDNSNLLIHISILNQDSVERFNFFPTDIIEMGIANSRYVNDALYGEVHDIDTFEHYVWQCQHQ